MRIGWIFACLAVVACSGDTDTGTGTGDDDDDGGGNTETRDFGQDFEDKYCSEYNDCSGTTGECPLTTLPTPTPTSAPNTTTAECAFDEQAADDCINGEWTCMSIEGFSFVIPNPACCAICGGEPCPTAPI
jgi:hypothetical protein